MATKNKTNLTTKQFIILFKQGEFLKEGLIKYFDDLRAELVLIRDNQIMLEAKLNVMRSVFCKNIADWKNLEAKAYKIANSEQVNLVAGLANVRRRISRHSSKN